MLGRDAQQVHPGAGALALPFRLGRNDFSGDFSAFYNDLYGFDYDFYGFI